MKNASNANNTVIVNAFERAIARLVFRMEDKKAVGYILMANGMDPKAFFGNTQSIALLTLSRPEMIEFDVLDDDGHDETVIVDLQEHRMCWKDNSTLGAIFTEWEDIPFCEE